MCETLAYGHQSTFVARVAIISIGTDPWSKEESLTMNQNDYMGLQRVKPYQD
jgi:hypothetical protein